MYKNFFQILLKHPQCYLENRIIVECNWKNMVLHYWFGTNYSV